MDLSTLTEAQRQSVMHVGGPLLVSAGAGSGKTFMLTQRIAYALLHPEESDVRDIGEVLAITFTEKAAGEIKARVKSTLRKEGLFGEALKVDAAWISTIHGMCARILRTHALELGIDPGFSVLNEGQSRDLIAESINEVLGHDNEIIDHRRFVRLFNEFPARSSFMTQSSVASMVEDLLNFAANLTGGLSSVSLGPAPTAPQTLAKELFLAYEEVLPFLEQVKVSKSSEAALAGTHEALDALQGFLVSGDDSLETFAQLLDNLIFLPRNFGGADTKEAVQAHQAEHTRIIDEVVLGLSLPVAEDLLALTQEVLDHYEQKKQACFALDNNDLLSKTLQAFQQNPEVAQHYGQRFKMVMVDEFQDTSQMQIDIIAALAGENCQRLCTVGDAQQSIYRFRGADVGVYETHKKEMVSSHIGAPLIELKKNFRSHGDVLSFVDRIFEQPQVFGDAFMSLEPHAGRTSSYQAANIPRIDTVLVTRPSERGSSISAKQAKEAEAAAIAQRFAAFRDAGHSAGDMVVLLGKMTYADVYAQALRDQDFECIITGGSLFDKTPEVHVVARLAQVLANPAHTAALFEVLTSPMFSLGADDLLELSTRTDEETGEARRSDINRGFRRLVEQAEEDSSELPARLCHAIRVMNAAWAAVGNQSLAVTIQQCLLDSGWMSRLEVQGATGMAQAGNILKAVRKIEALENEQGLGVAQVAQSFAAQLAGGLKEAPGALSGQGNNVVKIMTIHASKGLEFPLVAVADFYGVRSNNSKLITELCEGKAYASLVLGEGLEAYPQLKKRFGGFGPENSSLENMQDLAEFRACLKYITAQEELAEVRRKFYVALTRASEELIVSVGTKVSRSNPLSAYKDVVDDMRSALCGPNDFPEGTAEFEHGGSQPACFERIALIESEEDIIVNEVIEPSSINIPYFKECQVLPLENYRPLRKDVFSYSSLGFAEGKPAQQETLQTEEGQAVAAPSNSNVSAVNLGTAFHLIAQKAIEAGKVPASAEVSRIAQAQGISKEQEQRLAEALNRWFTSEIYQQVKEYASVRAELPFFVEMEDLYMEGEIDLFCSNGKDNPVLIVDYKTGGTPEETEEGLCKKHLLQAQCYAYATLLQGYPQVDLIFVRVEQESPGETNQPQVVRYLFEQEGTAHLRKTILEELAKH